MTPQERIAQTIEQHRTTLAKQVASRRTELESDNDNHHDVYRFLGVPDSECAQIDLYQNIGRFVYKYAGSMLEAITRIALEEKDGGGPMKIPNTVSQNPAEFHIDCVTPDGLAHEIKWRDATTDGDHVKKEANKVTSILAADLVPVRIMYFMPVRANAKKIQQKVIAEFTAKGKAYIEDAAWEYVQKRSGIDLREELKKFDVPAEAWVAAAAEAEGAASASPAP